jgi:tRNA dimethylallyltransferase
MCGVPHHLLDVASPKKNFTADQYIKLARRKIEDTASRDKLPIIVGGTGFYIDALIGRIVLPNVPPNAALRAKLEKKSAAQLFAVLKKRDPRRAKTIEPHHKRRLIRALEIIDALGKVPYISGLRNHYFKTLWIGIAPPMKELEKKITIRLFARLRGALNNKSRGMIAEAKRLHRAGLSYKRMEELGLEYRSLARLLQDKITRQQMIEELNRAIRKYAKRQIAYWKRNKDIQWFKNSNDSSIPKAIQNWLIKGGCISLENLPKT